MNNSFCVCGNIQIRGQLVSQNSHLDNRSKISKAIYKIDLQSIEVQNTQRMKKHVQSKTCLKMKCLICETIFQFIYLKKLFLEKTQPIYHSYKKFHIQKVNMSSFVLFENLFSFEQKKEEKKKCLTEHTIKFNEEDTDFDIMFSNKDEPFVGSYKQQEISVPIDECY